MSKVLCLMLDAGNGFPCKYSVSVSLSAYAVMLLHYFGEGTLRCTCTDKPNVTAGTTIQHVKTIRFYWINAVNPRFDEF